MRGAGECGNKGWRLRSTGTQRRKLRGSWCSDGAITSELGPHKADLVEVNCPFNLKQFSVPLRQRKKRASSAICAPDVMATILVHRGHPLDGGVVSWKEA